MRKLQGKKICGGKNQHNCNTIISKIYLKIRKSLMLSNTYLAMEFKLDGEESEDMMDGMSKAWWSQ